MRCSARRRRRGRRGRRGRRAQRGFTLIELMVALAISAILVTMVLSVFARMTTAYRRQQQVASLQVILAAAQNMIAQDARQAGFQMAQGFVVAAAPGVVQAPVQIVNSSAAPDELRLYAADATVQARIEAGGMPPGANLSVLLDANPFVDGELAVIVNSATASVTVDGVAREVSSFKACVVRVFIDGGDPTHRLNLDTAAPWGNGSNSQCDAVRDGHNNAGSSQHQTMIYRFHARAYRVDPTRPALGVLQRSPSGTLVAADWEDLGVGFADLQLAARMFESAGTDTDADGDAQYNWVSGDAMTTLTAPGATAVVTRLTISLAARTDRSVDGVASAATPSFLGAGDVDYNELGDHPSVALPGGDRIYRYTTNRIDMRNTGAGL